MIAFGELWSRSRKENKEFENKEFDHYCIAPF